MMESQKSYYTRHCEGVKRPDAKRRWNEVTSTILLHISVWDCHANARNDTQLSFELCI
jgi:hypothetical protein